MTSDVATTVQSDKDYKNSPLAKLVESDDLVQFAKLDDFLKVLNTTPPASFIREHPMAAGVKYIPIDRIELLLTKIFQLWHVEVLREGQMLNSIYTTVRLHYRDPITKDWLYQDGVGAAPIQTDKGKSAAELIYVKNDAIMKALPAAESYAVKDAAEKIGKVFGKDLNRRDTLDFSPSYGTQEVIKDLNQEDVYEETILSIQAATKNEEFTELLSKLTPQQKLMAMPIVNERRQELKNGYASPIATA